MQTLSEIRQLLDESGLKPLKHLGQNYLIDQNLMRKLLELAQTDRGRTVLEVGPGTGALTEELLDRVHRVVAVEIDRGLSKLLRRRLDGRDNLVLLNTDILSGKHAVNAKVLEALPAKPHLVANLPYGIATPLILHCLIDSWRSARSDSTGGVLFERMTFTVQREVADRLAAKPGVKQYGRASIIVNLLGAVTLGPVAPPEAFWPRPNVSSQIMRIDFDHEQANRLADVSVLLTVLDLLFAHRRKQIGWAIRRGDLPFDRDALAAAIDQAGVKLTDRAEQIGPKGFLAIVNTLVDTNINP